MYNIIGVTFIIIIIFIMPVLYGKEALCTLERGGKVE